MSTSRLEQLKNASYMLLNVAASILLVFTNKAVFTYPEFRSIPLVFAAYHFAFTGFGLWLVSRPAFGVFEPKVVHWKKMIPICVSFAGFVVLTNLSLAYNSVAFYQMAKVLTTPTIVFINLVAYRKQVNMFVLLTLALVCAGVAFTCYGEFGTSLPGTVFAALGILVTSVYQIWIGAKQKEFQVSSSQLLLNQAPLAAALLVPGIPFSDTFPDLYQVPRGAWIALTASGVVALVVNLSQFLIIGKTSAVTYNVVGHMKTCIIVTLGWFLSGQTVIARDVLGVVLAVGGAIGYTFVATQRPTEERQPTPLPKYEPVPKDEDIDVAKSKEDLV